MPASKIPDSHNRRLISPIGGIRCVFFDAAGTLIRTVESVGETYAKIGSRYGFEASPEQLDKSFRSAFREMVADPPGLGEDRIWWRTIVQRTFTLAGAAPSEAGVNSERFESCFTELFDFYGEAAAWQIYPDVEPALKQLADAGFDLWVLSNFDARLHPVLKGLGLTPRFKGVIASGDIGLSKPDPKIFAAACAQADWDAAQCAHVGDCPKADLDGAQSAGLSPYLLDRPNTDISHFVRDLRIGKFPTCINVSDSG